ncbi:MAG: hypothetical protein U0935_19220 [Pirellulales bacterium]
MDHKDPTPGFRVSLVALSRESIGSIVVASGNRQVQLLYSGDTSAYFDDGKKVIPTPTPGAILRPKHDVELGGHTVAADTILFFERDQWWIARVSSV